MKRLALLAFVTFPLFAQPTQNVLPVPDCIVNIQLTASGQTTPLSPNAGFNNIIGGCTSFAMQIAVSGFSSATVALQSAPNNAGVAGSWSTFAGTIFSPSPDNANPITIAAGNSQFVWVYGYNPWVRVALTAVSGTGIVNGTLFGWRSPSNTANGGGAATSVNATIVSPLGPQSASTSVATVNQGQAASGAAASGNPELVGGSDGTDVRTIATDTSGHPIVNINSPLGAQSSPTPALSVVAQGQAAPAAVPVGNPVLAGAYDGSYVRNIASDDNGSLTAPCQNQNFVANAFLSTSSSGSQQLVAGTSGKTIVICKREFSTASGPENVEWISATGSSCSGPTIEDEQLGIVGAAFDDDGSLILPTASNLCVNLAASQAATVRVAYIVR